jgi:catechol 2,3-dioxygenase-like lactoylglutathione lyase family enzyme
MVAAEARPCRPTCSGQTDPRHRLSLRTHDLKATERFYGIGLGLRVDRIGPHGLLVAGFLRFVEDREAPRGRGQILLSFEVQDFARTADRLNIDIGPNTARFRLRDPAGNDVDVRAAGQPL